MKHRAFTFVELVVVVAIIVIVAAILFPLFSHGDSGRLAYRRAQCQSNLDQIGLAFSQYTQDYDGTFPLVADARGDDWFETLQSYVKATQLFQCPTDESTAPQTTDYFYNARLSRLERGKIKSPAATILSGDGAGDSPPSYALAQLPTAWRTDQKSPAWRHLGGANYLFADGHVKWLKPDKITLDKLAKGAPTFLVGP